MFTPLSKHFESNLTHLNTSRLYQNVFEYVKGFKGTSGIRLPIQKTSRLQVTGPLHHSDVVMGTVASQITSLTIVYSTVYSGADQRKHQSSASLAFVRGIHRGPVNSPHKWPVTRKMFPFDDVIMPRAVPEQTTDGNRLGFLSSTNLFLVNNISASQLT